MGRWLKAFVFVGFVAAGYFKAGVESPIDLTLLFGVIVLLLCGAHLVRNLNRFPKALLITLGIFTILGIPVLWSPLDSLYASEKVVRLTTITLLASVAPMLLFRSAGHRDACLHVFMWFGVVMAVVALTGGETAGGYEEGRISVFDGGPLLLGRGAGLSCVIAGVLMMQRKLKPMIALAIIGCCAWALLLSASRGPLFALFLALFIAALPERSFKYRAVRRATICAITVGIVMFAFSFAPESTQERIVNFSTGNSTTTRLDLYRGAAHLASVNPQGIGWGQFGSTMQQPETYPHNVFLEVLVEAGWVPLFVLVVWIGFALKRARSDQLLLSCLLFMLLNALVSGDINGNRVLWSFVALAYLPTHGAIIRSSGKAAGLKKPAS